MVTPTQEIGCQDTWLWGLGGKQGMEASLCDIDSSHLHGGACQACQRPVGRRFVPQCRPLRLQTLCRRATRAIRVAALLRPEEKSKQSRGPNTSNTTFTDARDRLYRLPRPLPIDFLMTVVSPSAEQLPRVDPRPGRETPPRRVQCAPPNGPPTNLV